MITFQVMDQFLRADNCVENVLVHLKTSGCDVWNVFGFTPGNIDDLDLREGDIVTDVEQMDDQWYRGTLHGSIGYFPINYVKVLVSFRNFFVCFSETKWFKSKPEWSKLVATSIHLLPLICSQIRETTGLLVEEKPRNTLM